MRRIQYAIVGFVAGLLLSLLAGIIELKLLMKLGNETAIPFVIGSTVLLFIIIGVRTGLRRARRL